ncbi:hypothetical protein L1N85_19355 [Paenibacillus alkaliterrae]|uniref:hypothetical protein n=1 Tax=Paenibacillus alkaliterrae TaxID=320909 RepID=UPI001F27AA6F|nr:hypothetical protein [Paenibacillus alkaliterrae]MCF2940553.1 hypothetical protein [Paenibacillus alkaliterrae]
MKPTDAVPGKPYVLKMKRDEDPLIFQWLNMQGIYSDSIRYLIEKEIAENGLRNLQHFIPSKRNIQAMKEQIHFGSALSTPSNYSERTNFSNHEAAPFFSASAEADISRNTINKSSQESEQMHVNRDNFKNMVESNHAIEKDSNIPNPESEPIMPRKAGKNFGDDVVDSYR